jgi:hypothetical protein
VDGVRVEVAARLDRGLHPIERPVDDHVRADRDRLLAELSGRQAGVEWDERGPQARRRVQQDAEVDRGRQGRRNPPPRAHAERGEPSRDDVGAVVELRVGQGTVRRLDRRVTGARACGGRQPVEHPASVCLRSGPPV